METRRYFIDTEFIENGYKEPVRLISIAAVAEDGREFYAECSETDLSLASPWVQQNVIPYLRGNAKSRSEIRAGLIDFIVRDATSFNELWAYHAAYDAVLLDQLMGDRKLIPRAFPIRVNDLAQMASTLRVPKRMFPQLVGQEHNALDDARWDRTVFEFLQNVNKAGSDSLAGSSAQRSS
jgi:hypothetical protein